MRKREGIEPRDEQTTVGADLLRIREGHINGAEGQGSREPTGVRDRGTSARQSRELGRSKVVLRREVGWHNLQTGRKPDATLEVGCPHTSEETE
jgi:hypothetical protein